VLIRDRAWWERLWVNMWERQDFPWSWENELREREYWLILLIRGFFCQAEWTNPCSTPTHTQGCISQKHCKPKLIVEQMPPMVSMINLGLRCFWEMQPRSVNSSCWQKRWDCLWKKCKSLLFIFLQEFMLFSWYSLQVGYSKGQWCSGSE